MCNDMFHCPTEGLLDINKSQASECMPRCIPFKNCPIVSGEWNMKKLETPVKDQLHFVIHMALSGQ